MKSIFAALLLLGAVVSAPAVAKEEREVFTAQTTGEMTIDEEGRVAELSVDRRKLGDEVMQGFEERIRQWRFEPIVENGQPVRAKAYLSLALVVVRQPGEDGIRLGFEHVQFKDPPTQAAMQKASNRLVAPRYPTEEVARGVGAQVNLILRLDAEGRVAEVATESIDLFGDDVGTQAGRHAENFSRASEKVAKAWRLPGYENGVVTVPVRFRPPGTRGERWIRTRSVPVDVPAWVTLEKSSPDVVTLGVGGSESSGRWKLLTPLGG
ncbi:hypothetical protein [Arenimonas daejeonensis]|uniref:hypothetical protein n=1 Tax=Arenimonas daejeonensis TaxID=370777 RepID=UPI0011BE2527|nr:hypothetical protein [Arenimonas daejeonensis]